MVWNRRNRNNFKWLPNFGGRSRIPLALQNVFLSSNRGNEVRKAPPGFVANKSFKSPAAAATTEIKDFNKIDNTDDNISVTSAADTVISEASSAPAPSVIQIIAAPPSPTPSVEEEKTISPQDFLDNLLSSRGLSTTKYSTKSTGYYAKPTPLQQASYEPYLICLARHCTNHEKLLKIMSSGISPNPCNTHGESLIHMISRTGSVQTMEVLLNAGATLQVSDDYGRTPLHDACWRATPCFDMIELIANYDIDLFRMQDQRGSTPLSYVPSEHWSEFNTFLDTKFDTLFQKASSDETNNALLTSVEPNTRPIPDPENALSVELARMVAANKLTPKEAQIMQIEEEDSDEFDEDDDDDDESDDFSDDDDDDESDYDDDYSDDDDDDDSEYSSDEDDEDFSDGEMEEMMGIIAHAKASASQ